MADKQDTDAAGADPFKSIRDGVAKYQKLLAEVDGGRKLEEGEPTPTDLANRVNFDFWAAYAAVAQRGVRDDLPEHLEYGPAEWVFLNFGVIPGGAPWAAEIAEKVRTTPPSGDMIVRFMTDHLDKVYRLLLRREKIRGLEEEITRNQARIDAFPAEREALRARIEEALAGLSASDQEGARACLQVAQDNMKQVVLMDNQLKRGGFANKEERLQYVALKDTMVQNKQTLDAIAIRYPDGAKLMAFLVEILKANLGLVILEEKVAELRKSIETEKAAVQDLTVKNVRSLIAEEVTFINGQLKLCARMANIPAQSVPLAKRELTVPAGLFKAMDQILDYDPELFANRAVKKWGRPPFLVAPGTGFGNYDWKNNNLLVPVLFAGTMVETLSTAVIMYRTDVDQQLNEKEFINSYRREIKENEEIDSIIQLKRKLAKEYVTWIVKESQGYSILTKEIREWFEWRIGPKKTDPMIPRDYRGLTLDQIESEMKRWEGTEEGYDRQYRLGLLHFLRDAEEKKNLEQALACFEKAITLNERRPEPYWSAGVILKKLGSRRAVDMLLQYTRRAGQSWWSKKAQEHIAASR